MLSQQRSALFWGVCIPVRMWLATRGSVQWLRMAAVVIGSRWVLGLENGNEGFFGGPAWWKDERPKHGALWLGYAVTGWSSLLKLDVLLGMGNWLSRPHQAHRGRYLRPHPGSLT